MRNLRSVDLNLLPVFEAAYEERNLSRAAERLAMTQSAVSHALSRLRDLFRDELFVREARGVSPTPVADRIYAKLRGALDSVRSVVSEARGFDPKTSDRHFFLAIPHPLGPMIAVRLREQLARLAPGITVEFNTASRPVDLARGLREARIDAVVDWLPPNGEQFREAPLFDDGIVVVARSGHPGLRAGAAKRGLANYEFVRLRPRNEVENSPPGVQAWRQLKLNIVLEVSEIIEVFMVASQTDLCGLVPLSMAKTARDLLGLRVLPASPKMATVPVKLVWHASRDGDQAHVFLRQQLAIAAKEVT